MLMTHLGDARLLFQLLHASSQNRRYVPHGQPQGGVRPLAPITLHPIAGVPTVFSSFVTPVF
jgi:hypothetical protein